MAATTGHLTSTIARLITAADGDTLYRDLYLRRAGELLSPIVTRARYDSALVEREHLTGLLGQARAAVQRTDWEQVRELSTRAADLKRALDAEAEALATAGAVYGAAPVALDPLSPGLTPLTKRWSDPGQARADTIAALAELVREDAEAKALYAARQRALEGLAVGAAAPGAASTAPGAGSTAPRPTSPTNLEQQALRALERGDAEALRGLADSMLGPATTPSSTAGPVPSRARARISVPGGLEEPFPAGCLPRAAALGLEQVEATLVSPALATTISDFVERYALGASPALHDLARDGVARVRVAAGEASVPPEVASVFAETVSLFSLHLYVNSAGIRYVPVPVPRETLLVEAHPDGEEAMTSLLKELGLERRRVDRVDRVGQRHGQRQVAQAGQQQRGLVAGGGRVVLADPEQLPLAGHQAEEVDQAGVLDQGDQLVHPGRQHPAYALRDDHQAHRLAPGEAERPGALQLGGLDALDAGTEDLPDVRGGDQRQRQDAQRVGVRPPDLHAQRRQADADQQDGRRGRQAAEHVGVDPRRPAQPAGTGDAGDGQQHAQHRAEQGGGDRQDQRVGQPDGQHLGQRLAHRRPSRRRSPTGCSTDPSVALLPPRSFVVRVPSGSRADGRRRRGGHACRCPA